MSAFIQAVTATDFEQEVIEKSKTTPVLIDFWADWCAPCKQLMPVLHQLVDSLNGAVFLATVDTDAQQELSMNYGIRSLPTVLLMKNGEIVEQFMGVQPESEIRKLLEPHLNSDTESRQNNPSEAIEKAMELINQGRVMDAIPYLQSDSSLHGKLLLIKIYLQEGEIDKAKASFDALSNEQQEDDKAVILKYSIELIQIAENSKNSDLQAAIKTTISLNPQQGIEQMLSLLAQSKDDEKESIKLGLISAFNLIEDVKLVSQFRRKMASLIF